jgi:hypothetical protein
MKRDASLEIFVNVPLSTGLGSTSEMSWEEVKAG